MVEFFPAADPSEEDDQHHLLFDGESILIAEESDQSATLLQACLDKHNLPSYTVSSFEELSSRLTSEPTALTVVALELADHAGDGVLEELSSQHPDLGIVVVNSSADIETALTCLRQGADEYLTKPVNDEQFLQAVVKVLKKRRLIVNNRVSLKELQLTNLRTQFLHHLIQRMNSGYLSDAELEAILQTILISITSEEGLAFNRAFLALFDDEDTILRGKLAIGPDTRADAQTIWREIKSENLDLQSLFQRSSQDLRQTNGVVNEIVRSLEIPASQGNHPLIHACHTRKSVVVDHGKADIEIPDELIATLDHDSFVIVPLFSPARSLGVIIADNFITGKPIEPSDLKALEIFGGQASLAIEHSRLYHDMQEKIEELEQITEELEKNKDQLIVTERFTALGQMSAQLVHALRNPITSIGGTARLLDKRISEQRNKRFLKVLTKESAKVESTLNDLFNFVSDTKLEKRAQSLFDIVRRAVRVFYGTMKKQQISYSLEFPTEELFLEIDGEKVYQAFLHLIRNSIESMESGGLLTVGAEVQESTVAITICDTGAGMVNGELSRATDPFYTTKTYGTGMGLTLVEQILKQHQAYFSLTPNDDQGMTAIVTFPLSSPPGNSSLETSSHAAS